MAAEKLALLLKDGAYRRGLGFGDDEHGGEDGRKPRPGKPIFRRGARENPNSKKAGEGDPASMERQTNYLAEKSKSPRSNSGADGTCESRTFAKFRCTEARCR